MTNTTRIARALACATLLAAPAMAMADGTASIRIEGANGTLLTERTANIPSGGTSTLFDSFDADASTAPNQSASSLLVRAVLSAGLRVGFTSTWGTYINRINDDAEPSPFNWGVSPWWQVKVNHAVASLGTDDITIHAGDEIVWSFSPHPDDEGELAVTGPAAPQQVGTPFTVHVDRYDNGQYTLDPTYGTPNYSGQPNAPTPANGALVSYGSQQATTDAAGNAVLRTEADWATVVATAPNAIRDEARACGFAADHPEACGLDPMVQALPDVAPNQDISSVPSRKVTVTTSTGRNIDVDLPTPTRGGAPVMIKADDLDPSLTQSERREVMRQLASSLAWQLNDRAANGEQAVAPPTGTRWRGAWLGRVTTVAPLAAGEAVVSQRAQSVATLASGRRSAQQVDDRLAACGLDTHAVAVQRFGYAMVIVKAPAAGARACLARRGS